ncbi:hypothetical protein CBL_13069 [Carabus blaptoides fortunei]
MIVHLKIKIDSFQILMRNLCKEMKRAENTLVFHVHNTDFHIQHDDIIERRQLIFKLNIAPNQVHGMNKMLVTGYKVHNTGTLITVGKANLNIESETSYAVIMNDTFVHLPQVFFLKTLYGRLMVKVHCQMQIMVQMNMMPWFNVHRPDEDMALTMETPNNLLRPTDTKPKKEDEKTENSVN